MNNSENSQLSSGSAIYSNKQSARNNTEAANNASSSEQLKSTNSETNVSQNTIENTNQQDIEQIQVRENSKMGEGLPLVYSGFHGIYNCCDSRKTNKKQIKQSRRN